MNKRLLIAINEYSGSGFRSLEAALRSYTKRELLDIYLSFEGILGYTDKIIGVMDALGYPITEAAPDSSADLAGERDTFVYLPPDKRDSRTARQVYALGLLLADDCPENDCRLYLNTFNMCRELDEQAPLLTGWPREVVERNLRKHYLELERMYFMNHAIKEFKRGMQP